MKVKCLEKQRKAERQSLTPTSQLEEASQGALRSAQQALMNRQGGDFDDDEFEGMTAEEKDAAILDFN